MLVQTKIPGSKWKFIQGIFSNKISPAYSFSVFNLSAIRIISNYIVITEWFSRQISKLKFTVVNSYHKRCRQLWYVCLSGNDTISVSNEKYLIQQDTEFFKHIRENVLSVTTNNNKYSNFHISLSQWISSKEVPPSSPTLSSFSKIPYSTQLHAQEPSYNSQSWFHTFGSLAKTVL